MGDYIDILIIVQVKCLHMNYDNLFIFQSHPRSLKLLFRTGGKTNQQTLLYLNLRKNEKNLSSSFSVMWKYLRKT